MKLKIIITMIFLLSFVNLSLASAVDEFNDMINTSKNIEDWRDFEDFSGNVLLHVQDKEKIITDYYLTFDNKNIQLNNGSCNDFVYEIYTNEKSLKTVNSMIKRYAENGKLNLFENVKTYLLLKKTPIYFNGEKINISSRIGLMSIW